MVTYHTESSGGRVPSKTGERGFAGSRRGRRWCTALALVLWSLPTAGSALSSDDAQCRNAIGKGAATLADAVLTARESCHRLRMQGLLNSATECNDPLLSPASPKVAAAATKLGDKIRRGCADAVAAAALGYVNCPAPCDQLGITDYGSVATCLACFSERCAGDAVELAYGTPPAPSLLDDVNTCQRMIGRALRKYLDARVKTQQKCQRQEDRKPQGVDCLTADPKGVVNKARLTMANLLTHCTAGTLADLDSCATDVAPELGCLEAVSNACADSLFYAVYRPGSATPTPATTVFSTRTATVTRTPTATPAPTGTATPAPPPTATDTPTASPTDTPTPPCMGQPCVTPSPQPCNPDSESYGEPAFYRSLAYRWAPIIIQDTASKWNADFIGRIDYDNDWRSNNNWDNLPSAGIAPYIYYDVLETSTHWFIHYHTFHPRDWDDVFFGTCGPDPDCHENDTENLMVMIQKDGSTYGRFRLMETEAHTSFYQYALANDGVSAGTGPDADDLDNDAERGFTLFTDTSVGVNDPRPAIYIESKGHGICDWWDNNGPYCTHPDDMVGTSGNDGVMYYPSETATPSVPPNPQGGQWSDFKSPYNLISLWDDVWVLRSCLGDNLTFDIPFTYPGVAGNGSPFIGEAMDGDDYADDAATAWWAQNHGNLAPGDWTMDPAATVLRQLTFSEPVDRAYQYNPFLGIR
jgi:hypothetical protein